MFDAIGMNDEWLAQGRLIPCGAMGAVIVGSWLVEANQSVAENMAPVLTRLVTPLFTVVLLTFLVTMVWTRSPIRVEREVLIGFDLLLVLVLVVGLVLCTLPRRSARISSCSSTFRDQQLHAIPVRKPTVRRPREMADGVPSGLLGLGRARCDRVSASVRLR